MKKKKLMNIPILSLNELIEVWVNSYMPLNKYEKKQYKKTPLFKRFKKLAKLKSKQL